MPSAMLRHFVRNLLASALPLAATYASAQCWAFAGFKGNSTDGVYIALSDDGYHWRLANGGAPMMHQTEAGELMRDPFLQRAPDGTFVMVWTWSWENHTIGISTSKDLIAWTPHQQLAVMANEPTARNVWAPAIYWDAVEKSWLILWSSTIPDRFRGENEGDNGLNHRIFATHTTDFKTFTPAKVFFDPGYEVIDATIVPTPDQKGAPFHMVFKDERKDPLHKNLLTAQSTSMEGPWSHISEPFSETWSEGAAVIPVAGGYIAYYDHYRAPQHYGAWFTADLTTWTDISSKISFPAGMRHGSFLKLKADECRHLETLSATKP